ncbi:MAG: alpha/beta hydrolase [Flavobacterium sp.]
MQKIPVYFVPGLAAGPLIFENIKLPEDKFDVHIIEWLVPERNESLKDYVTRMAVSIKHDHPVLIGISFGGIIVQEMGEVVNARRVIIISSVKCNKEFPRRMRFAKATHLYSVFPTRMMQNVDRLARWFKGNSFIAKRLRLYEKYLSVRDKNYLDWAFKNVITWGREEADPKVIHIHGDADEVFPARYVNGYIPVEGGTHIMIINKFAWLNRHLPKIITDGKEYNKQD